MPGISPMRFCVALAVAALVAGQSAAAQDKASADTPKSQSAPQSESKMRETVDEAGQIATQPIRDVGLENKPIPLVLQSAKDNPYGRGGVKTCSQITAELGDLNDALGPDFTVDPQTSQNRAGELARAGGKTIVNTFIPFRSLVREISGAAPAERRLQDAVDAGYARRGFLRGLQSARGCKVTN